MYIVSVSYGIAPTDNYIYMPYALLMTGLLSFLADDSWYRWSVLGVESPEFYYQHILSDDKYIGIG